MQRGHCGLPSLIREIRKWWPIYLAAIFGVLVRGSQLMSQIPVGDEWHGLDAIWRKGLGEILGTFDPRWSEPMVLGGKMLLATVGLSEAGIYLPTFLIGTAMIILFPRVLADRIGRFNAGLFAWLLAISPMLVLYSRFFRPYIFTAFLSGFCFYSAWRWRRDARFGWGIAYALCCVAAIDFHLVAAPFVLFPFAFILILRLDSGLPFPRKFPVQFALVSSLTAGLVILLVGIPIFSSFGIVGGKMGAQQVLPETLFGSVSLILGTPFALISLPLLLLAAFGLVLLYREFPDETAMLLLGALCHCLAVIVAAPTSISSALVFSRYMMVFLPLILLALASGLSALVNSLPKLGKVGAAVFVITLLLLAGPLTTFLSWPNNFSSMSLQVELLKDVPRSRIRQNYEDFEAGAGETSPFYSFLEALPPDSCTIVELPWFFQLSLNRYPWLQRRHHQKCRIGLTSCILRQQLNKGSFPCDLEGLKLRNFVFLGASEPRTTYDFVVVHRNLLREFDAGRLARPGLIRRLKEQTARLPELLKRLKEIYGNPCYEDRDLTVFVSSARGHQLADSPNFSPASM